VIFHDDKKTELIGETLISLDSILDSAGGGQADGWHQCKCRDKYAGDIRVELTFWDERPREVKPLTVNRGREVLGFEKRDDDRLKKGHGPRGPAGGIAIPNANGLSGTLRKGRPLPQNPTLALDNKAHEESEDSHESDHHDDLQAPPSHSHRHRDRERHRDRSHRDREHDKPRDRHKLREERPKESFRDREHGGRTRNSPPQSDDRHRFHHESSSQGLNTYVREQHSQSPPHTQALDVHTQDLQGNQYGQPNEHFSDSRQLLYGSQYPNDSYNLNHQQNNFTGIPNQQDYGAQGSQFGQQQQQQHQQYQYEQNNSLILQDRNMFPPPLPTHNMMQGGLLSNQSVNVNQNFGLANESYNNYNRPTNTVDSGVSSITGNVRNQLANQSPTRNHVHDHQVEGLYANPSSHALPHNSAYDTQFGSNQNLLMNSYANISGAQFNPSLSGSDNQVPFQQPLNPQQDLSFQFAQMQLARRQFDDDPGVPPLPPQHQAAPASFGKSLYRSPNHNAVALTSQPNAAPPAPLSHSTPPNGDTSSVNSLSQQNFQQTSQIPSQHEFGRPQHLQSNSPIQTQEPFSLTNTYNHNALVLAGSRQAHHNVADSDLQSNNASSNEPPPYDPYSPQGSNIRSAEPISDVQTTPDESRPHIKDLVPLQQMTNVTEPLYLKTQSAEGNYMQQQDVATNAPNPFPHSSNPPTLPKSVEPDFPNYASQPELPPPSPNTMQNEMHIPDFEPHQLVHRRSFSGVPSPVPFQQGQQESVVQQTPFPQSHTPSHEPSISTRDNRRRSVSPHPQPDLPPLRTLQERVAAAQRGYTPKSPSNHHSPSQSDSRRRSISPLPPTRQSDSSARRRSVSPLPPNNPGGQLVLRSNEAPPPPPSTRQRNSISQFGQPRSSSASEYSTSADGSNYAYGTSIGSDYHGPTGAQSSSPRKLPNSGYRDPTKQPHVEDEVDETDSAFTNSGMTSGYNSWSAQPIAHVNNQRGVNNSFNRQPSPLYESTTNIQQRPTARSRATTPVPSRGTSPAPPLRNSEGAQETPKPLERRLTVGIPFSPDSYEMINPVGSSDSPSSRSPGGNMTVSPAAKSPMGTSYSILTAKEEKKAQKEAEKAAKKLAKKKIWTPGSRNVDLNDDDILPPETFAPEPEKKAPTPTPPEPAPIQPLNISSRRSTSPNPATFGRRSISPNPATFAPRRGSVSPQPPMQHARRGSVSPQPGYASPYDRQNYEEPAPLNQASRSYTSLSNTISSNYNRSGSHTPIRPLPGPPNAIMAAVAPPEDYSYQDSYHNTYSREPSPTKNRPVTIPHGNMSQEDWALSQELSGISIGSARRRF